MSVTSTYSASPAFPVAADATRFAVVAVVAALAGLLALELRSYALAGVFEYPLDDVYIHLAMAARMAEGTYGVNAGEPASAASSILYPVLLMPFAGTELQRLLPLFWNIVGLVVSAALWGAAVAEARLPRWAALFVAAAGPVTLNMSGVAFLGMEHSLHAAVSLATIYGLWRFLLTDRIAPWFAAAVILGPLLRLEGLSLSLAAAAVVFVTGHWRNGLILAAAAVLPLLAFMGALVAMGLPPLPSSILVKLTITTPETGEVSGLWIRVFLNLIKPAGQFIALLIFANVIFLMLLRRLPQFGSAEAQRARAATWVLAAVALAGVAHILQGQVGWLHRYEHYIAVSLPFGLALAASALVARRKIAVTAVLVLAVASGAAIWLPKLWRGYVWNPRAIYLQQAQMARFAQDFLNEPVAVNDLGRVVWRNPNYVLDLWGLASDRARQLRLESGTPPDGWAGSLTDEKNVRLAMIYDHWIGNGIGARWQKIGTLMRNNPKAALGGNEVSFYATDPAYAAELTAKLRDFAKTLPADARMELE